MLLLSAPPAISIDLRPDRVRHRSGPFDRKFEPAIAPSTSSGRERSPDEGRASELLEKIGCKVTKEVAALRIVKSGRKRRGKKAGRHNGRHGWKVFDFHTESGLFIEIVEGTGADKLDDIAFVQKRYGFVVVLLTGAMLDYYTTDLEQLQRRLDDALKLQRELRAGKSDAEVLAAKRETQRLRDARRARVLTEQRQRKQVRASSAQHEHTPMEQPSRKDRRRANARRNKATGPPSKTGNERPGEAPLGVVSLGPGFTSSDPDSGPAAADRTRDYASSTPPVGFFTGLSGQPQVIRP